MSADLAAIRFLTELRFDTEPVRLSRRTMEAHEAGHARVAERIGLRVTRCYVEPVPGAPGSWRGRCYYEPTPRGEDAVVVALAGWAGVGTASPAAAGAVGDLRQAIALCAATVVPLAQASGSTGLEALSEAVVAEVQRLYARALAAAARASARRLATSQRSCRGSVVRFFTW